MQKYKGLCKAFFFLHDPNKLKMCLETAIESPKKYSAFEYMIENKLIPDDVSELPDSLGD